jgi:hypothetical protein
MKEEAPLGNSFIGEPRGGRPAKDGGRAATHVAKGSQFCPKGVVVEVKGEIVERKGGKQGEGGRPPIFG